ncbi:MAG TPA: stage IV sporulation protein A [Candidatus Coprovivens excrementavium]|nr:stage IV sporulation protein A [Candidatus Coprovivens excrementavium]
MKDNKIIESISKRGNGEIYLGVVGAVRTGKSTFIKRFIENLVVPNITDEYEKKHCLDEIPQSAQGKSIMTTEPKFVPSNGATIQVDEFTTNIKLIDCVGYIIPGSNGYEDENGNPRMVLTPWFKEPVNFETAAEIGTEKVIKDHATIGIVVTSDGSFGEIKRENYIEAETKVINELKEIKKPFIVILNSSHPESEVTKKLAQSLRDTHDVPVLPISVETMTEYEIYDILKSALYEFPVLNIEIKLPEWVHILPNNHYVKEEYLTKIKTSTLKVNKLKDVDDILNYFKDSQYISKAYISNVDTSTGIVNINLDSEDTLYNEILNEMMGDTVNTKAGMLKIFSTYKESKEETEIIKTALKTAKQTGYGIVYPTLKDMQLENPSIVKQGNRYGVKLKATASSYHIIRADVVSVFEPIIGSEIQSKELINYLMKDYESDPTNIWRSEIFGRSLDVIVKEGIQAKLSVIPEATRYKLSQTITKIVNKGSNNLIAIVL